MKITTCSVTVMRSHDYCHFSTAISADFSDMDSRDDKLRETDCLRKEAARLADKAVEQYKIKKRAIEAGDNRWGMDRLKEAEKIATSDRTPEQQAAIKVLGDRLHAMNYDYQDDWTEQES